MRFMQANSLSSQHCVWTHDSNELAQTRGTVGGGDGDGGYCGYGIPGGAGAVGGNGGGGEGTHFSGQSHPSTSQAVFPAGGFLHIANCLPVRL